MFALFVALSVAGLVVGPALVALGRGRPLVLAALDGLTLGIVPVLLVVRTLPHLYEEIGGGAILLAGAGYAGLSLIERRTHGRDAELGIAVVLSALAVHSFLDGAALAVAFSTESRPASVVLGTALVLHKVPEGLFFASTVAPRLGLRPTLARVGLLVLATLVGALAGRELLAHAPDALLHALVAVGLGVMLRLVVHRHDVGPCTDAANATSGACFLGALTLALVVPAPTDALAIAQPRELSVLEGLPALFVETSPAILAALIGMTALRLSLGGRIGRTIMWIVGAADPWATALSWVLLGPRLAGLYLGGMVLLALRRARINQAPRAAPGGDRVREVLAARPADFDRIGFGYVAGLLVGAVLEAAVPDNVLPGVSLPIQMAFALAVCAVAAGPGAVVVAAILVHKGLALPASMTLLFAAQGLSIGRLAVTRSRGARVLLRSILLPGVVTAIAAFGAGWVGRSSDVPPLHALAGHRHVAIEWASAVVVLALVIRSLVRRGPRRWIADATSPSHASTVA